MRRISAVLLLVVSGFSLLAPALASDADSNLPACCRRAGKHHCSMAGHGDGSPQGPAFSAKTVCPMYPQFGAVQGGFFLTLAAPPVSLRTPCLTNAAGRLISQSDFSMFHAGAHLQRGPPPHALVG